MEEPIIEQKDNVVKVVAGEGYCHPGKTLCKLKDTGNGFIAKFPSHSNSIQTNYVCLGYAEAEYLYIALEQFKEKNT